MADTKLENAVATFRTKVSGPYSIAGAADLQPVLGAIAEDGQMTEAENRILVTLRSDCYDHLDAGAARAIVKTLRLPRANESSPAPTPPRRDVHEHIAQQQARLGNVLTQLEAFMAREQGPSSIVRDLNPGNPGTRADLSAALGALQTQRALLAMQLPPLADDPAALAALSRRYKSAIDDATRQIRMVGAYWGSVYAADALVRELTPVAAEQIETPMPTAAVLLAPVALAAEPALAEPSSEKGKPKSPAIVAKIKAPAAPKMAPAALKAMARMGLHALKEGSKDKRFDLGTFILAAEAAADPSLSVQRASTMQFEVQQMLAAARRPLEDAKLDPYERIFRTMRELNQLAVGRYRGDHGRMIDFADLGSDCGGNSMLTVSALARAELPPHEHLGLQWYNGHVRPVLWRDTDDRVIDLTTGRPGKADETIYALSFLPYSYLRDRDENVGDEEAHVLRKGDRVGETPETLTGERPQKLTTGVMGRPAQPSVVAWSGDVPVAATNPSPVRFGALPSEKLAEINDPNTVNLNDILHGDDAKNLQVFPSLEWKVLEQNGGLFFNSEETRDEYLALADSQQQSAWLRRESEKQLLATTPDAQKLLTVLSTFDPSKPLPQIHGQSAVSFVYELAAVETAIERNGGTLPAVYEQLRAVREQWRYKLNTNPKWYLASAPFRGDELNPDWDAAASYYYEWVGGLVRYVLDNQVPIVESTVSGEPGDAQANDVVTRAQFLAALEATSAWNPGQEPKGTYADPRVLAFLEDGDLPGQYYTLLGRIDELLAADAKAPRTVSYQGKLLSVRVARVLERAFAQTPSAHTSLGAVTGFAQLRKQMQR